MVAAPFLMTGALIFLWLAIFAFVKLRYPDSSVGRVLAVVA